MFQIHYMSRIPASMHGSSSQHNSRANRSGYPGNASLHDAHTPSSCFRHCSPSSAKYHGLAGITVFVATIVLLAVGSIRSAVGIFFFFFSLGEKFAVAGRCPRKLRWSKRLPRSGKGTTALARILLEKKTNMVRVKSPTRKNNRC